MHTEIYILALFIKQIILYYYDTKIINSEYVMKIVVKNYYYPSFFSRRCLDLF